MEIKAEHLVFLLGQKQLEIEYLKSQNVHLTEQLKKLQPTEENKEKE